MKEITKYGWLGYTALRSNIAYVSEVASRTLFMTIVLYIFMRLWTVVYKGSGVARLGGLNLAEMLWYLAVTESIMLSAPRVSMEIDEDVRTGRLAIQLLRPLSYMLARLAQFLGERIIRFAVNAATGIAVAFVLVGPIRVSGSALLLFAIVLPIAFIVDFLGYFAIGLCAFWLESTAGLTLIYSRLTMLAGGMIIPLDVFPDALQTVVRVLPFASMVYGPGRVFVGGGAAVFMQTICVQAAALVVFGAIVCTIQRFALKRIQSHGG